MKKIVSVLFLIKIATQKKDPSINAGSTWQSLIQMLSKNLNVQQKIDEEKTLLINTILKFEELKVIGPYSKHKISGGGIIEKMIKYVVRGNENDYSQATMINVIKILTKSIQLSCDENTPMSYVQEYLNNLGCMLMILKILSSIKSTISNDLLDALLDLGCALLEGGNTIVQTTVYNYFTTNSVSENMFRKLYNTIKTQKDKLNFRGLDYYHKSDDDTEAEIMEKIMTFLQLFCEGHNLDLQKYIRKQTNSQENFDM